MNSSDTISLIAIIVSLFSLWFSYKTERNNKLLSAADRRTQIHALLVDTLLEAQELHHMVSTAIKFAPESGVSLPDRIDEVEQKLKQSISLLREYMSLLQSNSSNDPLHLESVKSKAMHVNANINKVSSMIKELPIKER